MTKTYANRSNARRAAKAAGLDLDTLVFATVLDGTWTWTAVAAPAPAKPYRIRQGNPARVAARKAQAAATAAALVAATTTAPAAPIVTPAAAGTTPRHKEFALYGRSSVLSPVQFVHQFLNENGKVLSRKDALYALAQAGVNYATARTQYQRWFSNNK